MTTTRTTCRDCGSPLDTVLNLGTRYVSSFPRPGDPPLPAVPLHLTQCVKPTCGLVQLADTTDPDLLYGGDYWYRSGVNETMVAELRSIVEQASRYTPVKRGSVVLDLGANDGTLLDHYPSGCHRIGVEPSATFDRPSMTADEWRTAFFPDADLIDEFRGRVRVITSIACLYDLDDPHAFVQGVADLLAPDGIWIVQFQDLAQMLAATAFDNLCHEHLFYPSLHAIEHLIAPHGLEVVHAERRSINGGSLRLIIKKGGSQTISTSVNDCRKAEADWLGWEALAKFSWRVNQAAAQVRGAVDAARAAGLTVDLYGASTKGNTLLQVAALGPDRIRQAWERSPAKVGRTTVTGIPIVSEEAGRADPPASLLCNIWQFREAVLQREAAYLAAGGAMIFPLPEVDVVQQARVR
jgi:hypothetical protein